MAKVALYGRNSGDAQEKSETIETQRRLLMEWAKKEGHEVVGWYADEGVRSSVPVADRKEGGRLLRDAARGRFELVACYKLSRWSRKLEIWTQGRRALRRHGVELGCLQDDTRDRTPGEKFSLGVRILVGEYERDNIEQQCLDGRYSWVQDGYYPGGVVPYGYRVVPDPAPRADKKRRSVLVLDPAEAEVVRLIFRWCVEEGLSCPQIARRLTDRGVPRSSEGAQPDRHRIVREKTYDRWSKDTVLLILRNPRYKGDGTFGGGRRCVNGREPVAWPFPAIVDAGTWDAAQLQVSKNRKESPRNCRRTYLLRGLVHCTHCVRRMVGHTVVRGRREYAYYYCPGPLDAVAAPCPLPYVPLASLEMDLWETLVPLVQRREETVARLRVQLHEGERRSLGLQASCDGLKGAIEKKRAQIERALALHLEDTITREQFLAQKERLTRETERLQEELDRQSAELSGCRLREDRLEGVADWLARWQEDVAHASPAGQRRVIEQMVDRIELAWGEKVEARYVFCLDPGTESASESVPFAPDTSPYIRRKRNNFLLIVAATLLPRALRVPARDSASA